MQADRSAGRPLVATAQQWLIDLFLLGVAIQFFLAGLGVFDTAKHASRRLAVASTFDVHRAFGNVLLLVALAIAGTGVIAKRQVRTATVLLALMGLQAVWTNAGSGTPAVAALHVVGAFAITIVAFTMHPTARARSSRNIG